MSEPYELKMGLCSCGCGKEFPVEQMTLEGDAPYSKDHLDKLLAQERG